MNTARYRTNKIDWVHGQLVKVNNVKPIKDCLHTQMRPDVPAGTIVRIFETHNTTIPYADVYAVDSNGKYYYNYFDLRYLTAVEE